MYAIPGVTPLDRGHIKKVAVVSQVWLIAAGSHVLPFFSQCASTNGTFSGRTMSLSLEAVTLAPKPVLLLLDWELERLSSLLHSQTSAYAPATQALVELAKEL